MPYSRAMHGDEARSRAPVPADRFPWGWFVVAESREVTRVPHRARYFARDLLALRDVRDHARVLDARCGCGRPYADDALSARGLTCVRCGEVQALDASSDGRRALPVHESHGLVFVWHHPEARPPTFTIPDVPESGAPGWLPWELRCMTIRTHPREIVENVVDIGHFVPVHQTEPRDFENVFDGHRAIQRAAGVGSAENRYAGSRYALVATYHGPAYQVTEFESRGLAARLVNAHTPIDAGLLHLRFGVLLSDPGDAERGARIRRAYVDDLQRGFAQDVAIWEHKVFRERPVLCDGDGPIMKLRAWYAQFYA